MGDKGKRRFYIGGRWYSPDNATPLCRCKDIFEAVTLYQTPKGTFFTFRESTVDGLGIDGPAVEVLSKAAARSFMDDHAAGIITANYDAIMGEPKEG